MKITVYHGTQSQFIFPSLMKSKDFRDFGNGFYVTENYFDALSVLKFKSGYIYEYELNTDGLMVRDIQDEEELAKYVIKNRMNIYKDEYDVVIGGTVCNCAQLFKSARNKKLKVSINNIVELIRKSPYDNQYCLKTEKALNQLSLKEVHKFTEDDFC